MSERIGGRKIVQLGRRDAKVKKIKVKIIGSGKDGDSWRVDLPTYILDSIDYGNKTAEVYVFADEVDTRGRLREKYIQERYKEHPKFKKFKRKDVQID